MAKEGRPEASGTMLYYPLTKMNFLVSVEGISGVAAFSEVTGIEASVDVIEFRQGNANSLAPVKMPGLVKHGNITLKMGYTKSQDFKTWVQSCVAEVRSGFERHNITIELIDTSVETNAQAEEDVADPALTWVLTNAWVCKYNAPDFNASASEVAIESVEIAYEEMTTIPN